MSKQKLQTVRGVRDLLGAEIEAYNHVVDISKKIAAIYNYNELQTPIFEYSEVFLRSLGETSDVVNKETYTFMDRDKTSITLRPEFTAAIVRAVSENGLTQKLPLKLFTYGPIFRHERPQKGRYRQFHQIDFEIFGKSDYSEDFEIIHLGDQLLKKLGIRDKVVLNISSIGDVESRAQYTKALVSYFARYSADLSEDSKMRLEKNPLRILDSKDHTDKKLIETAPRIYEYLSPSSSERYEALKDQLTQNDIPFYENFKIVRGLDYYSDTVFEYITEELGAQGTVLAGGRYDALFSHMCGIDIPGIGFGAGIERLSLLLPNDRTQVQLDFYALIPLGDNAKKYAVSMCARMRERGVKCDIILGSKVGKQMSKANELGATHAIVFGDNEIESQNFKVKDMLTGEESLLEILR